MKFWDLFRGWVVDIIRRFWDRGEYQDVEWMQKVHDAWFSFWVEMKTYYTMKDVDEQATILTPDPEVPNPIYWEEEEGETPLGGPMRLYNEFTDNDT